MNDAYEQTKQTNGTSAPKAASGRPADVGEEAVIAAGCAICERGGTVTATALRSEIGRGRPQRLKEIWDKYVAAEAERARERADLPADLQRDVAKAVADLSEKITDFVSMAFASAVQHADGTIERQQRDLVARERAADAEVQAAYKLVEDADAQHAGALLRISQLETDLRAERDARLTSEKRAAESESVVKELRAQLSVSKTENDELRSSLGELRAFKERVRKQQAQNKDRTPDRSGANPAKKTGKPDTLQNK